MNREYYARNLNDTFRIAKEFCHGLPRGAVVALHGDLGAGKTSFVKGMGMALDINPEDVTSPTYTLLHEYTGRRPMIHADLYRLESPEDAIRIGLDEAMDSDAITVVEWPERAAVILPARTIHVFIRSGNLPDERVIHIIGADA